MIDSRSHANSSITVGESLGAFCTLRAEMKYTVGTKLSHARRSLVGGSDARIIMGQDEDALFRLWREKRGEIEPEDLATSSSSLGS